MTKNILRGSKFLLFNFSTLCSVEKYEKRNHAKTISWNQLFSCNFFSKNVDLTEKCRFSVKIVIALCCVLTYVLMLFSRNIFQLLSKYKFADFPHCLIWTSCQNAVHFENFDSPAKIVYTKIWLMKLMPPPAAASEIRLWTAIQSKMAYNRNLHYTLRQLNR